MASIHDYLQNKNSSSDWDAFGSYLLPEWMQALRPMMLQQAQQGMPADVMKGLKGQVWQNSMGQVPNMSRQFGEAMTARGLQHSGSMGGGLAGIMSGQGKQYGQGMNQLGLANWQAQQTGMQSLADMYARILGIAKGTQQQKSGFDWAGAAQMAALFI